ncbi:mitochondrial Rho GTPase 2-like isoform X1 [Glycine soja]|uniref:Mitochondrial Rho GTPase n=1 Tax=Glycine soja TaxID=3848 RepID=A0A445IH41_GLYSO|nr:mitochondrial Rho GTPase 2-like isoform X1 [Glycine soja]RZB85368.1 Mitochondrial Rho GTPase 2 [Glycine soja]
MVSRFATMVGPSSASGRREVRIAVVGDGATGKSTLIAAMASESFPKSVPPVLPPTRLPRNLFPDSVPLTLIDTPSSLAKQGTRNEELKLADTVVLTYACDEPVSFERVTTYWLPELHKLEVKAPVIVVGCKLDLRDENQLVSLESLTTHIMKQFTEVVTCVECSAATLYQVPQVFYFAQKAVLHPVDPLFDYERHALTDRCVRALRRIFVLCDHDMDGALNDEELNEFQVRCFNAPLQPFEVANIKTIVEQKVPEGVNSIGLTFPGFIYVHNLFLKKGRTETLWAVLRKFEYDNDLKLRDDFLPVPSKQASDQSVELTSEAVEFLNGIFRLLDTDKDRYLRPAEVDKLFDIAPESPWNDAPYKDAAEKTDMGYISLNGFLSQWALMTLLDPKRSLANLIYIGYNGNPAEALCVTRRRSVDRKKQTTERNVFQCYVFGSKHAGKSALMYSLLGRPFSNNYTPTTVEQYAANVIELKGVTRKILILREIPEDGLLQFLSNQDCLAACDVAVFVYDSSDEYSWKKSRDLLEKVVRQGELTGYRTPCLLIAAKDDLAPVPRTVLDSVKVTQALGIKAPIHVSMKLGDSSNVYNKIVNAAEHPHLSIPETETARRKKQHNQLLHHSLIFALVGAAMAVAGLTACRVRAVKKNTAA